MSELLSFSPEVSYGRKKSSEKVRRCILCGAVLRSGNGGALCRPCLLPDGAGAKGFLDDWALALAESAEDVPGTIASLATAIRKGTVWKGDGARLAEAIVRARGLAACARALGTSPYKLRRRLAAGGVSLATVLAINSTLGKRLGKRP